MEPSAASAERPIERCESCELLSILAGRAVCCDPHLGVAIRNAESLGSDSWWLDRPWAVPA
jgi:hypothetical protein